ncbi:MAG: cyanophycin synthetase, partial [Thermoanaerobaculia bacterium]|nr:cyanophycin synthetase [Thermoanaerobaculia bacterium]
AAALGIPVAVRRQGLAACPGVPGRFEAVRAGQPFAVYVDFAHTPAGLESALRTLRDVTPGRLHCLIGAGGGRDPGKRPAMGRIAARLADRVVFTSDNPRHEDPAAILAALTSGVEVDAGAEVVTELDRRRAIARVLEGAAPGDTVLLAGKGHETTQTVGGVSHPFDDRVEARLALGRLGHDDAEVLS